MSENWEIVFALQFLGFVYNANRHICDGAWMRRLEGKGLVVELDSMFHSSVNGFDSS